MNASFARTRPCLNPESRDRTRIHLVATPMTQWKPPHYVGRPRTRYTKGRPPQPAPYVSVTLRLNGKAGARRRSVRPVDLLPHSGSQLPGHGFSRPVGCACIDRRSLSRLPVNYARESVLDDVLVRACANPGNNNATCVQGPELRVRCSPALPREPGRQLVPDRLTEPAA
ncbi:hypothetical protein MTO96_017419 [Rhipicephalus appendiculatus]